MISTAGQTPGKTPLGREKRTPLAPRNNNRMMPPRKPPGCNTKSLLKSFYNDLIVKVLRGGRQQWFHPSIDRVSRRGRWLLIPNRCHQFSQPCPWLRTKPGSLSTTSLASRMMFLLLLLLLLLLPSQEQRASPDPEISSPASPNSPGSLSDICPGRVWPG